MAGKIKKAILVFSIIFLIVVSGCIKLNVNQQIRSDGTSRIEMVYDMSGLYEMAKSQGGDTSEMDANMANMCKNFNSDGKLKNAKCEVTSDYKVIASGEFVMAEHSVFSKAFKVNHSIPYTTYQFDAKAIFNGLPGSGSADTNFSEASLRQLKQSAGLMGIVMTYNVEMPGQITKAEVGEIKGNIVSINIFDLVDREHAYIESQELNVFAIAIAIVVIVVLLLVVILVLFKRRKSSIAPA
ncbi:MAG: hypothetical protein N3F05_04630 [Candidatus Diapherotrites archaeon]|nr:hypothetical protein [Candidatus Diapherotrites archaeon]